MVTVGAVVSTTSPLLAPSDPAAPGLARVRVPLFPTESLIVPPLRANAEFDSYSRSLEVCGAAMV